MPTTAKGTPYVVSTDLVANYPTVSSDLADHIDDNLAYNAVTINAQTGSGANAYTFALTDASEGKLVTASNAAAATYTVPPQSAVTWADGAVLSIMNQGAGVVTLAAGSGVTINGSPLLLPQYAQASIIRTASNVWTVINTASGGLVKIVDSTFSAQATVSVNNCFSSSYDNYRILLRNTGSTAGGLRLRLRVSGTDASGSNYNNRALGLSGSNVLVTNYGTNTESFFATSQTTESITSADIHSPNLAVATSIISDGGADTIYERLFTRHTLSTAYDGFTIYHSTGGATISGTLRVYGYRN